MPDPVFIGYAGEADPKPGLINDMDPGGVVPDVLRPLTLAKGEVVPDVLRPLGRPSAQAPTSIMEKNLGGDLGKLPVQTGEEKIASNYALAGGYEGLHGLIQGTATTIAKMGSMNNKLQRAFNKGVANLINASPETRSRLEKSYQDADTIFKDIIKGNQDLYDHIQKEAERRGVDPENPSVKTIKFVGGTAGTLAKFGLTGPAAMPVMAGESFIEKSYQGIDEGKSPLRALVGGGLSGTSALAIGAIPGGNKAFDSVWKIIINKGIRGTGIGLGLGATDAVIDSMVYDKNITPSELGNRLKESVQNILGLELAGVPVKWRETSTAKAVASRYRGAKEAREEILPKIAEKMNEYADLVGRSGVSPLHPRVASIKQEIESLRRQAVAVTVAESLKIPFGSKEEQPATSAARLSRGEWASKMTEDILSEKEGSGAIQIGRTEKEVSRNGEGGEDLTEGGKGIRRGLEGDEAARKGEKAQKEEGLDRRAEPRGEDRRKDLTKRRMVSEMGLEEAREALLTSEKTGLPNLRSYNDEQHISPKKYVAFADLDNFKKVNDLVGHAGGDELLGLMGTSFREVESEFNKGKSPEDQVKTFHQSGDELLTLSDNPESIKGFYEKVREFTEGKPISLNDETGQAKELKFPGISYGIGSDPKSAELAAKSDKELRRKLGLRTNRDEVAPLPGRGPNWEDVRATRPISADELRAIAESPKYTADFLGGQQLYEKAIQKLGLRPDATLREIGENIGGRIKSLGKTIQETALKIWSKIPEMGRSFAESVATFLHSREGQIGAAGKDIRGGMREREMRKAFEQLQEDDYAGLSPRDRNIVKSTPKAISTGDPMSIENQAKLRPPITKGVQDAASEITGEKNWAKAAGIINEKIRKGEAIDLSQDLTKTMDGFASIVNASITGKGSKNENGTPIMMKPFINTDPGSVKTLRDLTEAESRVQKLVSPSHLYHGMYGPGLGAMERGSAPQVDMVLGNAASFVNQNNFKNHFLDLMAQGEIKNNSSAIRKEMSESRENLYRLFVEASKAHGVEGVDPNARARLDELVPAIKDAVKQVYTKMQEVCEKYPDARIMTYAEFFDNRPEWLTPMMRPGEIEAAKGVHDMMLEMKKGLKESGVPVLESRSFMPHLVKEGLSGDTVRLLESSRLKGWGEIGLDKTMDPEYVRFAHRRGYGMMTLPDLYGAMDKYITQASNIQAKHVVADKWTKWADMNQIQNGKLAEKVRSDIEAYIKPDARNKFLDATNKLFMVKLIGWNPTTAFKHMAKIPLSVAELGGVRSIDGLFEVIRGKLGSERAKEFQAAVDAIKGSRYFEAVELGTGDISSDQLKKIYHRVENSTHHPVQFVESSERTWVLVTSLMNGYKDGLSPEDAVRKAISDSMMVNFVGSDKAPILRGSVNQSIFFLQNTPWKLMELQIRRAGDLFKGIHGIAKGDMPPELRRRFAAALRNAAMLASIGVADKYMNTNILAWTAHVPALAKALIEEPVMEMFKALFGEDHDFNWDPMDSLFNGLTVAPGIDAALRGYSKYGFSEAFWADLLVPNVLKLGFRKKANEQMYGEGPVEKIARTVTGQPIAEEQGELKEGMAKRGRKQQKKSSAREINRWEWPWNR